MNESKCRVLVCSLCLLMIFSSPALAARDKKTSHRKVAVSKARKKVKMTSEKRNQLNMELFAAVDHQEGNAVVRLLSSGAQINATDRAGMTPLMHAALRGEPEMVRLLLSKGAAVNMMDIFGITALMQASWAGHTGIVKMLVTHGADPNMQSTEEIPTLRAAEVSALMGACMNDNYAVAKFLLARNANVNERDAEGQTALMYAAHQGDPRMVKLLVSHGANMEIKDQFGRTALTLATIYGRRGAVCALIAAGADVDTKDIHNMTPAVYAAALDHDAIYRVLKAAMVRRAICAPVQCLPTAP
ncbi:MAG: ankyrin repeat domain-containing protein [Syntrophobacteraceae bacterium]